ncbi:hypothetical protein [Streptomyces sp. NPDC051098]|uniref:hypothetical protein n=1 Tax=Streptomyces sp. NPDC051098 TaxID=3155411 RepID=UPI00341CB2A6
MSPNRSFIRRRVLLAAAVSATCALGPVSTASAVPLGTVHTRQAHHKVDSAELAQGLYQSAYSARNNTLWSLAVANDDRAGHVYVANRGSGTTTAVDPRRGTVLAVLPTGTNTNHVVLHRGTAYVVDKAAGGAAALDSIHRVRTTG